MRASDLRATRLQLPEPYPCRVQGLIRFILAPSVTRVVPGQVEAGQPRIGTPICIPSAEFITIGAHTPPLPRECTPCSEFGGPTGKIVGMEKDHKEVTSAVQGDDIAVKIEQLPNEQVSLLLSALDARHSH